MVVVVQEAVSRRNPTILQMVLAHRDYQRYCNRVAGIPELLHKLKQVGVVRTKREARRCFNERKQK